MSPIEVSQHKRVHSAITSAVSAWSSLVMSSLGPVAVLPPIYPLFILELLCPCEPMTLRNQPWPEPPLATALSTSTAAGGGVYPQQYAASDQCHSTQAYSATEPSGTTALPPGRGGARLCMYACACPVQLYLSMHAASINGAWWTWSRALEQCRREVPCGGPGPRSTTLVQLHHTSGPRVQGQG